MKLSALIFVWFLSFGVRPSVGAETKVSAPQGAGSQALPHCINDRAQLEAIDQDRKLNSKSEFKYRAMNEALASDSNDQLIARLTYAETLAANCPEFENEILPVITTVMQNRVRARKGDARSVVFQRDQFASSLNSYSESKWREFLCPTNLALWQKASGVRPIGLPANAFNYYLFRHSSKFQPPNWAKKPPLNFPSSDKVASCLKVFGSEFR